MTISLSYIVHEKTVFDTNSLQKKGRVDELSIYLSYNRI